MLPKRATLELRDLLRLDPVEAYRKITEVYAKKGSIDATASKLGIPPRTLARIVSEHPALQALLKGQREKLKISPSYKTP